MDIGGPGTKRDEVGPSGVLGWGPRRMSASEELSRDRIGEREAEGPASGREKGSASDRKDRTSRKPMKEQARRMFGRNQRKRRGCRTSKLTRVGEPNQRYDGQKSARPNSTNRYLRRGERVEKRGRGESLNGMVASKLGERRPFGEKYRKLSFMRVELVSNVARPVG